MDDLKAIIWMNLIKKNVVKTGDVNLATNVCSQDVGDIKGKTVRSRPTPVFSNVVEMTYELMELHKYLTV